MVGSLKVQGDASATPGRHRANCSRFLDDFEQALINLREAISRNPANLEARVYLAATLESSGDRDGAQWEAEEIRSIQPDFSTQAWLETYPMTDPRQAEQLEAILARLDL